MIGTTKLNDRLYLLASLSVTLNHTHSTHLINAIQPPTHTSNDYNLWNLIFGHTSNAKLLEINKSFSFVKNVNQSIPCDICFYAKKRRREVAFS